MKETATAAKFDWSLFLIGIVTGNLVSGFYYDARLSKRVEQIEAHKNRMFTNVAFIGFYSGKLTNGEDFLNQQLGRICK